MEFHNMDTYFQAHFTFITWKCTVFFNVNLFKGTYENNVNNCMRCVGCCRHFL